MNEDMGQKDTCEVISNVRAELNQTDIALGELMSAVDTLTARLKPVSLVCDELEKETCQPDRPRCEIDGWIQSITERVLEQNKRILIAIDELQI